MSFTVFEEPKPVSTEDVHKRPNVLLLDNNDFETFTQMLEQNQNSTEELKRLMSLDALTEQ